MMFRSTLLAGCACVAYAGSTAKLLVVNNSKVIGGGSKGDDSEMSELLMVDLQEQTQVVVNKQLPPEYDFVKGSVTCGTKWYGIATNFGAGNLIATVDLKTGVLEGIDPVPGLWYALKCGEQEGELLAVTAVGSPPKFGLVRLTLTGGSPVTDAIGEFPSVLWGGWVSIFSFSGNELQATFPVKKRLQKSAKSGEIYRMDVTTGQITMHKEIKDGFTAIGVPYWIKHVEGDSNTVGLFADEQGSSKLKFCDVDLSGDKVQVSKCKQADHGWWANGATPVQCPSDDMFYFPSKGATAYDYEPIMGVNLETGELVDSYHLNYIYGAPSEVSDYYIGSHACLASVSTLV